MEDVGGGRVVQDERFVELAAQPAQVLDIAALVEDAGLPEEPRPEHATAVQQVRHGVGVLGREGRGGEGRYSEGLARRNGRGAGRKLQQHDKACMARLGFGPN